MILSSGGRSPRTRISPPFLDVYRLSIDYVVFSNRIAKTLTGINRAARDQWLRSAQREALASLDEFDEDVAKLKTAIDDWRLGEAGMPIDQAANLIRGKVEGSD